MSGIFYCYFPGSIVEQRHVYNTRGKSDQLFRIKRLMFSIVTAIMEIFSGIESSSEYDGQFVPFGQEIAKLIRNLGHIAITSKTGKKHPRENAIDRLVTATRMRVTFKIARSTNIVGQLSQPNTIEIPGGATYKVVIIDEDGEKRT
jgi:hypothetical protein